MYIYTLLIWSLSLYVIIVIGHMWYITSMIANSMLLWPFQLSLRMMYYYQKYVFIMSLDYHYFKKHVLQ